MSVAALVILAAVTLSAQDINLQMAAATQPLDPGILRELGVSPSEAELMLAYQREFRQRQEESTLEMNVIRARLARMLYSPDTDPEEIDRLLEQAGELRLEQEKAQVRHYYELRNMLGEERWLKLTQMIRERNRTRVNNGQETPAEQQKQSGSPQGSGTQPRTGSSSGGSASGGSTAGASSSGGSSR